MSSLSSSVLLLVLMFTASLMADSTVNFYQDVEFYWGNQNANVSDGGKNLTMSLYNSSGCGFQSYNTYLFGRFDMHIMLVPNNSAGTVTTSYLSSQGPYHDEIDFEFLGNVTGQPYICHTNIIANGTGGREQQFYLCLMVNEIPIRVFNNNEAIGVPFPNSQPMNIYSSIWDGDSWATEGGRVKIDWADAPFAASFKNFIVNSCEDSSGLTSCGSSSSNSSITSIEALGAEELDTEILQELAWVEDNYMIYGYCTDYERFPQGFPPECYQPRFMQ
ncbi:hypothetical protein RHSIM_Rhsim06G0117500 [Rhododendron simsii]|uniref:Xyloglucan endotransglucosylase/hydrolase n=1 Tax=Rhododendron simsii TaxID=118357 RepID=A0A834GS36_RHOSS|nr:hypothetical protein RHSIM_Rhsim06G0117500 [Rhododendron simsii]